MRRRIKLRVPVCRPASGDVVDAGTPMSSQHQGGELHILLCNGGTKELWGQMGAASALLGTEAETAIELGQSTLVHIVGQEVLIVCHCNRLCGWTENQARGLLVCSCWIPTVEHADYGELLA
jgi:hypothetical protein